MTADEIRARLNEIAPPPPGLSVTAGMLARYLAVSAQRRWRRIDMWANWDPAAQEDSAIQALCGEFAALHLAMALTLGPGTAPDARLSRADLAARQITTAWGDFQSIGEWLWLHLRTLGIDVDEVNRLEDALQELMRPVLEAKAT